MFNFNVTKLGIYLPCFTIMLLTHSIFLVLRKKSHESGLDSRAGKLRLSVAAFDLSVPFLCVCFCAGVQRAGRF